MNLLINESHELSKIIAINTSGISPFSIKLKWATPKIKSLSYNINGLNYKKVDLKILSQKSLPIINRFTTNFPSTEEHILSLFISTISVDNSKKIKDLILGLQFQKYPNHKKFCLNVCDLLIEKGILAPNEWLNENTEYKDFFDRIAIRMQK